MIGQSCYQISKAVGQTQAELHILEVEKLDACIRPLSQIQSHMKRIYHNHDIEDYIDYHDIRYVLHITIYHFVKIYSISKFF